MTDEFQTKETRPMTLILLPPHAEFIKDKAVMTEQMVMECQALEDSAASWIATRLGEKGYTVRVLAAEELEKDPELQDLVERVNDRYDKEWSKIVRKPGKLRRGRYNVGDDARKLCSVLDVDGILLARVHAVGIAAGKQILMGFVGGDSDYVGHGRLDMSVVNGKTGTVEGYFFYGQHASLKDLTRKHDRFMKNTSKRCLRLYPDAAEVLPALGLVAEKEAEEEEDEGEKDIIEEFGALLVEEEEDEEEQEAEEEPPAAQDTEGESEESQPEEAQESDTAQNTEK
jgi:hypothetical protein